MSGISIRAVEELLAVRAGLPMLDFLLESRDVTNASQWQSFYKMSMSIT